MVLALFEPNDELTAIFRIVGVALWAVSAFASGRLGGRVGGAVGLVGLGLAVFFFPSMWQEADAAFGDEASTP
jgi:hypothetical protein